MKNKFALFGLVIVGVVFFAFTQVTQAEFSVACMAKTKTPSKSCKQEQAKVNVCLQMDLTTAPGCFKGVAVQYKDTGVCSALSGDPATDCLNYVYAAQKKLSSCKKITDAETKDSCYTIYAHENKQPAVCANITNSNNRDTCYVGSSFAVKKSSYCLRIVGSGWRVECVSQIAVALNNIKLCKQLKDVSEQGTCMEPLLSTVSSCQQIDDPLKRYDCVINAGINAKDISVCDTPAPQGNYGISDWKDGCLNAYAVSNKDASVCNMLAATSRYKKSCTGFFTNKPMVEPTVPVPSGFGTLADALYLYQIYYPTRLTYKESPVFWPPHTPYGALQNIAFLDSSKNYATGTPYDFYLATYNNPKQQAPQDWFNAMTTLNINNISSYQSTINSLPAVEFPASVTGKRTIYFFAGKYVINITQGQLDDNTFNQIIYTFQKANIEIK